MENSNSNVIEPNKPVWKPSTLSEFYSFYYDKILKALPAEEQAAIKINLTKTAKVIRGEAVEFQNVRLFIKSVVEKAEEEFDNFTAKQKIPAAETPKPEVDTGQK